MKILPFLLILLSLTGVCYGQSSQGGPQYLMGMDHGRKGWANPCSIYSSGISYMQCNAGYADGLRSRPVAASSYVTPPPLGIPQQIYTAAAYENQVGVNTGLPVLSPTT